MPVHHALLLGVLMPLILSAWADNTPTMAARKQTQTPPDAEQQFTRLIRPIEGPELFRAHCAPCHGLDAKGAGPAASALKAKVPDLTLLARNNRGQFPVAHVRQIIS